MVQLSNDCFAFAGKLLPIEEVEGLLAARITAVREVETVGLGGATGRVLAADLVAPVDLPPFDNSAVDGYAVRHADLNPHAETRLLVVDRVTAGQIPRRPVAPGEAIRIFTGAPMPPQADTVFMQEDCRLNGAAVVVPAGLEAGANRRLSGEDVRAGSVALAQGRRLGPQLFARIHE